MDSKTDITSAAKADNPNKPDPVADLNLATLMQTRTELAKKHKKAAAALKTAKPGHFLRFWLGGGAMLLVTLWLAQELPDYTPIGMFLLSASIIFWLRLWIGAFFSAGTVRRLQVRETATKKLLEEIDLKIAFCHQVLEEAKRVRVRRSARALVEKEAAAKRQWQDNARPSRVMA